MAKNIAKYRNIYIFIIILASIGLISGFFYYKIQAPETKETIKETINIKEDLNGGYNNILKSSKKSLLIFGSGCLVIPIFFNLFKIFYEPFTIGFIFSFLCSYNLKLAFLYCFLYQFFPFIFLIVLIRISISLAATIIRLVIHRERKTSKHLQTLIKKYFLITAFLLMYEFLISIFSTNINAYLMTFLS